MDNELVIINENGEKVSCDILFSFDCTATDKSYLVYTDNSRDNEGNVAVHASIYYPYKHDGKLYPIETEFEWQIIEVMLEKLQESIRKGKDYNEVYKEIGEAVDLLFKENRKYKVELKVHSKEDEFLGTVYVEGNNGRFVIGANSLCDLWMKDCPEIDVIEFLCEYKDGILMVADISDHHNLIGTKLMDKKVLYSVNDKETIHVNDKYSIEVNYVVKVDKKERMIKEVNTLDYQANYIGDLDIDVYAQDIVNPKISNRMLIDDFL